MKDKKMALHLGKIGVLSLLFYGAVYFENAQQERLVVLLFVFVAYLALGIGRHFLLRNKDSWYALSFFLDIGLVYTLEVHSRLLINYFFHFFYLIILLEAFLTLKRNRGLLIGAVAVLVSLIKYGFLIYYKFSLATVSQMVFFLFANVLILVMISFAQYHREEREKKDMLYQELLDTHKQLKKYVDEVSRLTLVEERNRIARDLHDTLGHHMTALIMQMEMAGHMLETDPGRAGQLLEQGKKTARESLAGIREVVETLRGDPAPVRAISSLQDLVGEFSRKTGVQVQLSLSGSGPDRDPAAEKALFRILQEALTNAVRHGQASRVDIDLSYAGGRVDFLIRDNGGGNADFQEGYGLQGIRERVEAGGGRVEFTSRDGFTVKGFLSGEEDQ
ncbi:sensor histidine kinase [Candidatus Formimonas warabiya]|nr:sensor histidine kinase [Candidatus Formimonas warabiya]